MDGVQPFNQCIGVFPITTWEETITFLHVFKNILPTWDPASAPGDLKLLLDPMYLVRTGVSRYSGAPWSMFIPSHLVRATLVDLFGEENLAPLEVSKFPLCFFSKCTDLSRMGIVFPLDDQTDSD